MGVTVHGELETHHIRQTGEDCGGSGGEQTGDECQLIGVVHDLGEFFCVLGKSIVQFRDQDLHFRDELDQTFRDQQNTEVFAVGGTGSDHLGNVVNDFGERLLFRFNFFRDQSQVHVGLEDTFQRDVGSGTAHQLDEVPVFLGRVGVAGNVADNFAVNFAGGVETEGSFDKAVLQVTIDGLRAADNLDGHVFRLVVFSQQAGVGVGVVTADNDDGGDAESLRIDSALVELFGQFQFGSAGADHIEPAGVAVGIHEVVGDFNVFVVDQTAGTALETVELGSRVQALDTVVNTGNNVVTAGCLTAGEDHTHIDRVRQLFTVTGCKSQVRHVAGGGKESCDLFRIGKCRQRVAFDHIDGCTIAKCGGQFRAVRFAGSLQRRDFHCFAP